MSILTSTTPSTSAGRGSIVNGVPLLPEAVVGVSDFEGDYEGER